MKRFLFSLILLGSLTQAFAQYKEGPFHFSLQSNALINWLYTDAPDRANEAIRMGTAQEIHLDYFFEKHFAFSTGVIWSVAGGKMQYLNGEQIGFQSGLHQLPSGASVAYTIQYLELPLGLKMTTREIGYTTLFADFGVQPMFRLQALGTSSDQIQAKQPVFKEVSQFTLGYHGELGINYSFGNKTSLIVALVYRNTFLDFTSDYLKPKDTSRINQAGIKLGFAF